MMRYLTERLPAMTVPKWVENRIQPIAIRDVLRYLVGSAAMAADVSRGFDIGGPDVLTYRDMMQRYAEAADLKRRIIVGVPVLTPKLSSLWVSLVTPVPGGLARPLVESLVHEVVCDEHDIAEHVPDPPDGLIGFDRAVRLALRRVHDAAVTTRWSSAAVQGAPSDPLPSDPDWAGGSLFVDERRVTVDASPAALWRVLEAVGGERGWYSWGLAWRVRGLADRLVGGPGLRRGRRDPLQLLVDDAVDFWRVEEIEDGTLLRLRAEMRVPGLAWLELRVEPTGRADAAPTVFAQRALFHPKGLLGPALLVVGVPVPRDRLRRHAAQHRPRRGAGRTSAHRPAGQRRRRIVTGSSRNADHAARCSGPMRRGDPVALSTRTSVVSARA